MANLESCYCGSNIIFQDCCYPFIKGIAKPNTVEALMRSRYTAFAIHDADYLVTTSAKSHRNPQDKESILDWATTNTWQKLVVINATVYKVEFKAYYLDSNLQPQVHHELSSFVFENGSWFYLDGSFFEV